MPPNFVSEWFKLPSSIVHGLLLKDSNGLLLMFLVFDQASRSVKFLGRIILTEKPMLFWVCDIIDTDEKRV
jgi:hypothetical protein